jgi:hypothetical protein
MINQSWNWWIVNISRQKIDAKLLLGPSDPIRFNGISILLLPDLGIASLNVWGANIVEFRFLLIRDKIVRHDTFGLLRLIALIFVVKVQKWLQFSNVFLLARIAVLVPLDVHIVAAIEQELRKHFLCLTLLHGIGRSRRVEAVCLLIQLTIACATGAEEIPNLQTNFHFVCVTILIISLC